MSAVTGESPTGAVAIGGMTCASCAARVEKKLNKLDGVTATVNFATETARARVSPAVSDGELIAVVEQAGYTAALPAAPEAGVADAPAGEVPCGDEAVSLRQRLLVSLALAIPVPAGGEDRRRRGRQLEHPGFHAHLVLCDAASPGGSAVMRLPGLEPGLDLCNFASSPDYRTPVHFVPWRPGLR